MNTIAAALAGLLCSTALALAPAARADSIENLICLEQHMGLSDSQIEQSLHDGNPTIPPYILRGKILNQLGLCDESTP